MPSTTNSLPGYWCGVRQLVQHLRGSVRRSMPDRLSEQSLERLDVPARGPQLQLGVAARRAAGAGSRRPRSCSSIPADVWAWLRSRLFGQAQHRGQRADHPPGRGRQGAELRVRLLRRRPRRWYRAMQRDGFDLVRFESRAGRRS